MGSHYVDQDGFEFLASSHSPTLTSHSAEITGVSHCTWTYFLFFLFALFLPLCIVGTKLKRKKMLLAVFFSDYKSNKYLL